MHESPDLVDGDLALWERRLAGILASATVAPRELLLFDCGRARGSAEAARRKGAALLAAGLLLGVGLASVVNPLGTRQARPAASGAVVAEKPAAPGRLLQPLAPWRSDFRPADDRGTRIPMAGWSGEKLSHWMAAPAEVSFSIGRDEALDHIWTAADGALALP